MGNKNEQLWDFFLLLVLACALPTLYSFEFVVVVPSISYVYYHRFERKYNIIVSMHAQVKLLNRAC